MFVRTVRHPAAEELLTGHAGDWATRIEPCDHHYEAWGSFDEVYRAIVEEVVAAAGAAAEGATAVGGLGPPYVAYAVPGSPFVAERTVAMLSDDPRVSVRVLPAPSFLDLAWARLGVDPLSQGVRLVDASSFGVEAAGDRGPLLVAQAHSRALLSQVKLAVEDAGSEPPGLSATLLHHLGLPDEVVAEVPWADIDRTLEPDHLTSLWVPRLASPVAGELSRLVELARVLRAKCPWDMVQTHGSLARHLLEECYETLDAIEALVAREPDVPAAVVEHLEEELGDLLFQIVFHAGLAAEEGRFDLAGVARGVHDKLVSRHPHVFGDVVADTPDAVASNWEVIKRAEKGRTSVTEGIPSALPALALAAKLQRKAAAVGYPLDGAEEEAKRIVDSVEQMARLVGQREPGASSGESGGGANEPDERAAGESAAGESAAGARAAGARAAGDALLSLARLASALGVDPEAALRASALRFRGELAAKE